jgi:hypothetical protein
MHAFALRVHSLAQLSANSDVYSFGVFLLELITGRQAASLVAPESTASVAHWVILLIYDMVFFP